MVLMTVSYVLSAQRITIVERNVKNKEKPLHTWVVPVGDDLNLAKKTFRSFVRKELRLKPESEGKRMLVAQEVNLPAVSAYRGDLKGIFFSENNTNKLGIAFALGYDIALNSNTYPVAMRALRTITLDYLRYHYIRSYDQALNAQEEGVVKLKARAKKVEKEIASLLVADQRNRRKVYKTEDVVAKQALSNEVAASEREHENLSAQLLELNQEIVRKHVEMNKTREAYNGAMTHIRRLRTVERPQAGYGNYDNNHIDLH